LTPFSLSYARLGARDLQERTIMIDNHSPSGAIRWRSRSLATLAAAALAGLAILACSPDRKPDASEASAAQSSSPSVEALRDDYRLACREIAESYVYLEEKTGLTPEAFLAATLPKAEAIGAEGAAAAGADFLAALRALRSMMADGHFGWSLGEALRPSAHMNLGVVLTLRGERLIVASRAPDSTLLEGDEILTWDEKPALEAVRALGGLVPQSTERSTLEIGARYLAFEPAWMPLRAELADVPVAYARGGERRQAVLRWREGRPSVTRNGLPSLEELPADAKELSGELYVYALEVGGERFSVIHPRAFMDWRNADLDAALRTAEASGAGTLVIDLKDSAGGGFNQVVILLRALGVDDPLAHSVTERRGSETIRTRVDFSELEREDAPSRKWKGPVVVRVNPVAGSACDFFAVVAKRSGRAVIIGEGSAGRGAGTDTIDLPGSGASIDLPRRDRTLDGPGGRIEGGGALPDLPCEGSLEKDLALYLERGASRSPAR